MAVAILDARAVEGGVYAVVLDGPMTGLFAHEAFGHLSEGDHVHGHARLRDIMALGRRFGPSILSLADGADLAGVRGSYKYDDEGGAFAENFLDQGESRCKQASFPEYSCPHGGDTHRGTAAP